MRLYVALVALAAGAAALAVPAGATHPGANGKLVFERPAGNGANMFTVAPNGSGLTRLTNRRGAEGDSSWSPDGSKVAFACARTPRRGPFEICVVNADGSGLTQLTRHRGFSIAPAWSPDGTKIVYATDSGAEHLRLSVMNADGSGKRRLTRNRRGRDYSDPQWSPDGTTIAFAVLRSGETQRSFDSSIALVNAADGGNLRRLTPRRGPDELNPNWSPDGATIAFEVTRLFDVRQSDIWLMGADGTAKRRLTRTRVFETNPAYSPDGTRIAFTSDRDNRNLSRERLGRGFELYTMATDGSDVVRITTNRRAEIFPDWQPLP
jgi:TolB protein